YPFLALFAGSAFDRACDRITQLVRCALAARRPSTRTSVVCPFCNRGTPIDEYFCAVCGRPVWFPIAKNSAFGPNTTSMLLTIWAGAMMGLIGIPIVATSFPPNLRAAGIVGILMLFTLTAWLAFRRR
ncbi:MAG: hypothetical protein ABL962_17820, partial [Fimbriimonadaceae bacterium]